LNLLLTNLFPEGVGGDVENISSKKSAGKQRNHREILAPSQQKKTAQKPDSKKIA
jgi:hypothetical protein